jgi:hypothetical protein
MMLIYAWYLIKFWSYLTFKTKVVELLTLFLEDMKGGEKGK